MELVNTPASQARDSEFESPLLYPYPLRFQPIGSIGNVIFVPTKLIVSAISSTLDALSSMLRSKTIRGKIYGIKNWQEIDRLFRTWELTPFYFQGMTGEARIVMIDLDHSSIPYMLTFEAKIVGDIVYRLSCPLCGADWPPRMASRWSKEKCPACGYQGDTFNPSL